jgi:hypothetical protein
MYKKEQALELAVPWLRRLVACLPPRRPGFDPGLVYVGFVVDKVALGQVFPRVLRFSPVNFVPLVLHYTKKLIVFITGLHNKPQGCGASVDSVAGPFLKKTWVGACIMLTWMEEYIAGYCGDCLRFQMVFSWTLEFREVKISLWQ